MCCNKLTSFSVVLLYSLLLQLVHESALTYNLTMSYDVLLARSGAARLDTFGLGAAAQKEIDEDDAAQEVPEIPIEQPPPPHMPLPLRRPPTLTAPVLHPHEIPIEEPLPPHMPLRRLHEQSVSPIPSAWKPQHADNHLAATGTPTRKISSSSKFMNAFSQFYGADNSTSDTANTENTNHSTSAADSANKVQQRSYDDSFPEIKGRVESKLMSMWHNVKYGKYVSMKLNHSKSEYRKHCPIELLRSKISWQTF